MLHTPQPPRHYVLAVPPPGITQDIVMESIRDISPKIKASCRNGGTAYAEFFGPAQLGKSSGLEAIFAGHFQVDSESIVTEVTVERDDRTTFSPFQESGCRLVMAISAAARCCTSDDILLVMLKTPDSKTYWIDASTFH